MQLQVVEIDGIAMQIDFERVGEHHNFEEPKWVLLQLGCDEESVIRHGSGVTIKTTDRTLTTKAVGLAETRARYLGLYKFYWSKGAENSN